MPSAQKPAGAEGAERALSRDQPVAADAAAPTPANQGSASAAGAEFTDEDLQQDPLGNGDLLPPDRQGRKGGRRPELHRGPRMLQVIFSFFPEGRESFALMSRCRADPPPTTGAQRLGPRSNSGRGKGLQASAAPHGAAPTASF